MVLGAKRSRRTKNRGRFSSLARPAYLLDCKGCGRVVCHSPPDFSHGPLISQGSGVGWHSHNLHDLVNTRSRVQVEAGVLVVFLQSVYLVYLPNPSRVHAELIPLFRAESYRAYHTIDNKLELRSSLFLS